MLYDAAILSWAYIQQQLHCKRNMQPSVHGSTIMITKAWEQPAFSINRQMDKDDSLCLTPHTQRYSGILFSHEKNEIMPFEAMWRDLAVTILSDVNQRNTINIWYQLDTESKKIDKSGLIYKTKIDSQIWIKNLWYQTGKKGRRI